MDDIAVPVIGGVSEIGRRNQVQARQAVDRAYPFRCCAVCGLQIETCLHIAHLDHNAANNNLENLARLCPTHHWMYDACLFSADAIRMLQAHWQVTTGIPDHRPRMKDAGVKAARVRMRRAAARRAVATRRKNSLASPLCEVP